MVRMAGHANRARSRHTRICSGLLTSPNRAGIVTQQMNHYTLLNPLIGGILIGLASLLATVLSGKVPGISGAFGRLLVPATPDKVWRALFLLGLIGGAALCFAL